MTELNYTPRLRSDVVIVAQPAPGKPDRHVVSCPDGSVLLLGGGEVFLCGQMDGRTAGNEARRRFEEHFGRRLAPDQWAGFVHLLGSVGLLEGSHAPTSTTTPGRLRVVSPSAAAGIERVASVLTGWVFTGAGSVATVALSLVALGIGLTNASYVASLAGSWLRAVERGDTSTILSPDWTSREVLMLMLLPCLRELGKVAAIRRLAGEAPEIRGGTFLKIVPGLAVNLATLFRWPRGWRRLRIAAAGLQIDLLVLALGAVGTQMFVHGGEAQRFAVNVTVAGALNLLLNVVPLGMLDGSLLVALALGEPSFRSRAVRLFRRTLLGQTPSEPLTSRRRRTFFWYGLFADLYEIALEGAILGLIGYFLVIGLDGVGAVTFLALLAFVLRGRISVSFPTLDWWHDATRRRATLRKLARWALVLGVLALLFFVPYSEEVSGPFRVEPFAQGDARAQINSQIDAILVAEGEPVKAGQPLVKLSSHFIERDLEPNRAALERERSKLRLLEEGPRPEEIAASRQKLKLAETEHFYAQQDAARARNLRAGKAISEAQLEDAQQKAAVAADAVELARRELEAASAPVRRAALDEQRAEVRRLEAEVAHLERDLAQTSIVSPIDGTVTTFYLAKKIGQRVSVGDVLVGVEDRRTVWARVALPEEFASRVKTGAPVRARAWTRPDRTFAGHVVSRASSAIDKSDDLIEEAAVEQQRGLVRDVSGPTENVVPMLVQLENSEGLLLSNMTGYAKIGSERRALGLILLDPLVRFARLTVWSWIP